MNFSLMVAGPRVVSTVVLLLLLGGFVAAAFPARRADTEAALLARILRERNPVKRAKFEIRLGRLQLFQAINAYDKGNTQECYQLLAVYLERMKGAWATLKSSGRQASRHPQGFKELDIALRQDARYLEDLAHRVPYHDRAPVEKVAREVEDLRYQVLRALFPSERPRKKASGFMRRVGPDPSVGVVQG